MLSVVLATFDRQSVYATLSALKQLNEPVEIILIDDASPKLVYAVGVKLHRNPANRGLSYCRNKGLELASNDCVAFIDDDAIPTKAWSQQLAKSFSAGADIVGGSIAPEWVTRKPWWFCFLNECLFGTNQETGIILGCNFAVRKSFLASYGLGFDERLGRRGRDLIAGEESELLFRARDRGAQIVFNRGALVFHLMGADKASFQYFLKRVFAEGRTEGVRGRLRQHLGYFLKNVWRAFKRSKFRACAAGLLTLPVYLAGGIWGKTVG